jgi:hypothetical protein
MSITSQRYIPNFEPAPPVLVTQSRATFAGLETADLLELHKISALVSAQPTFFGKVNFLETQVAEMTKATKCRAYLRRLEQGSLSLVRPLEGNSVEVLPVRKSVFGTVVASGDIVYIKDLKVVEGCYDMELDLSADLEEGAATDKANEGCLLAVPILSIGTGPDALEATLNLHIVGVLQTYFPLSQCLSYDPTTVPLIATASHSIHLLLGMGRSR